MQLIRLMAQNQANNPNKELNAGIQQVLDNQTQEGNMIPQGIASSENNQSLMDCGNKKLEEEMISTLKACKACGELGHVSQECPDEWPHCDANYPVEEYPIPEIT